VEASIAVAKPRTRIRIQYLTILGITLLMAVMAAGFGWLNYRNAQSLLLDASTEATGRFTEAAAERLRTYLQPQRGQIATLVNSKLSVATSIEQRLEVAPIIAEMLDNNPNTDAIFAAYPNGEFVLFRMLREVADSDLFQAPPGTALMVQSQSLGTDGSMKGEYRFYGADAKPLGTRQVPDYRFDPRQREWFRRAAQQDEIAVIEPYVFFTTKSVGLTVSRKSPDAKMVVGLDVTLATIVDILRPLRTTPSTEIAMLDPKGRVAAYIDETKMVRRGEDGSLSMVTLQELDVPVLRQLAANNNLGEGHVQAAVAGRKWQVIVKLLPVADIGWFTLIIAIPEDELFASARQVAKLNLQFALVLLLAFLPAGWIGAHLLAKPIVQLARETKSIASFDFAGDAKVQSVIAEVADLGKSLALMKKTISEFFEVGRALAIEGSFHGLLDRVLREGISLVQADGGTIYLLQEDGKKLNPEIARGRDGPVAPDKMPGGSIAMDGVGLEGEISQVLLAGKISLVEREIAPGSSLPGFGMVTPAAPGTRMALIVVPLFNRQTKLIGGLILSRSFRAGDKGWVPSDQKVEMIRAVCGAAGIAIENQLLLQAQKDLMNALIKLIAGAIDAKSSYTGSHCARVPVLTKMLAEAACREQDGPFAGFSLTAEQWEAIEIASWLHDCGKVTTPEYVVDKATKLETIYDRIHEIRMRFEVLKHDAETQYWRGVAEGGDPAILRAQMSAQMDELDGDFSFVATCNLGGEFMDPAHIERLANIAAKRWKRTLSDRLGISDEEAMRKGRIPAAALPVDEPLLSDREDHITYREARDKTGADASRGFKVPMPEYRMNRGEIYNLSIGRGTLTDEERYIINDHIAQSIIMLESLPLPGYLRHVPELAGGHHEKMDGTGYPRRLTGQALSPVARMMAVADVFEALTASDRPYKKAKTLSEAIKIMGFMKKERHLDPDLLDLFLRSGLWKTYADQYLDPSQIDTPDIDAVLRMQPA
jgi:hypothetical protein